MIKIKKEDIENVVYQIYSKTRTPSLIQLPDQFNYQSYNQVWWQVRDQIYNQNWNPLLNL